MPDEPNSHPMEERLKEAARRRRAEPGAPQGLDPIQRRLLQSEVRRVYGAQSPADRAASGRLGWWFRWPGLAAIGSVVLLAALAVTFSPRLATPPSMELAKLEAPAASTLAGAAAEQRRAVVQDSRPAREADALRKQEGSASGDLALSRGVSVPPPAAPALPSPAPRPALAPAGEPRPLPSLAVTSSKDSLSVGRDAKLDLATATTPAPAAAAAPAPVAAIPAAPAANVALLESLQPGPPPLNLNFQRVDTAATAPAKEKASTTKRPAKVATLAESEAAVLNQFQVSVRNGQVQIVDGDGSVYQGPMRIPVAGMAGAVAGGSREFNAPVQQNRLGGAQPRSEPMGEPVTGNAGANAFAFQAVGTNRSTRQAVRLDGELRQNMPQALGLSVQNATPTGAAAAAQQNARYLQQNNAPMTWEFRSTVKVGGRSREMNAIQVPLAAPVQNAPAGPGRP